MGEFFVPINRQALRLLPASCFSRDQSSFSFLLCTLMRFKVLFVQANKKIAVLLFIEMTIIILVS